MNLHISSLTNIIPHIVIVSDQETQQADAETWRDLALDTQ